MLQANSLRGSQLHKVASNIQWAVWRRGVLGIHKLLQNINGKGIAMKLWRTPFDQAKKATKPGIVLINKERCKGCEYCVDFCPRGVLEMTKELNPKGYALAAVTNESLCLGCGLCEVLCPEFAIHVISSNNEN